MCLRVNWRMDAGQTYNLCNNDGNNYREEFKQWCHHECGLTPRSFPAHLHSSLFEGVAGHAICANKKRQSYTGLEVQSTDVHVGPWNMKAVSQCSASGGRPHLDHSRGMRNWPDVYWQLLVNSLPYFPLHSCSYHMCCNLCVLMHHMMMHKGIAF